jgi:hypothetical protein
MHLHDVTPVTMLGREGIVLEPGQELFSDEIAFPARAGECLAVSIYLNVVERIM